MITFYFQSYIHYRCIILYICVSFIIQLSITILRDYDIAMNSSNHPHTTPHLLARDTRVLVCQKQASRAGTSNYIPQYLWDVITCPCPRYLLLVHRYSYINDSSFLARLSLILFTADKLHTKRAIANWPVLWRTQIRYINRRSNIAAICFESEITECTWPRFNITAISQIHFFLFSKRSCENFTS